MSVPAQVVLEDLYRGGPVGREPEGGSAPDGTAPSFTVPSEERFESQAVSKHMEKGLTLSLWGSVRASSVASTHPLSVLAESLSSGLHVSCATATTAALATARWFYTCAPTSTTQMMVNPGTRTAGDRIRKLVEEQRIDEARREIMDLKGSLGILAPELAAWARLLAPPRFKEAPKGTGVDRRNALEALKAAQDEFQGEWVALDENSIIGHNQSKVALYKELKAAGKAGGALLVYVD